MREKIRRLYWVLNTQFGIDIRRLLLSSMGISRFLSNWRTFRQSYDGKMSIFPCLHDWYEEGGSTNNEYFWQDLYVAQKIYIQNPRKHVDIGSRIDGFVTHVASFREIEVFDIRPLTAIIPGVIFKRADFMNRLDTSFLSYCDSLSCLHALEHFGLGRYGDPIDPQGFGKGLRNMANILSPNGRFYLSVPIGKERVEFNAHRVFDPTSLVRLLEPMGLKLKSFSWISHGTQVIESESPESDMVDIAMQSYALGIFVFIKNPEVGT